MPPPSGYQPGNRGGEHGYAQHQHGGSAGQHQQDFHRGYGYGYGHEHEHGHEHDHGHGHVHGYRYYPGGYGYPYGYVYPFGFYGGYYGYDSSDLGNDYYDNSDQYGAQPDTATRYYCESSDAYYPEVTDCPEGWQVVTVDVTP